MSRFIQACLVTLGLLAACGARAAEIVVIVNPASGVERMTREDVVNVFMARFRQLPSGVTALPLDLSVDSPERRDFYLRLINKSQADVNAYWARLLFTGRATPPQQVPDSAAAVSAVAENKGAIAYVDKRSVDARVKVVLELPQ